MATTDSLTDIDNRRSFEPQLMHECTMALSQEAPLTLVLFDMNGLKHLNDTYGHPVGDAALQKFTEVVQQFIRSSDLFARLGGDEFGLLLPETRSKGALALVGRIHKQLDVDRLTLPRGQEIEISATCGMAELPAGVDDEKECCRIVWEHADTALYAAKEQASQHMGFFDGVDVQLLPIWHPMPEGPVS